MLERFKDLTDQFWEDEEDEDPGFSRLASLRAAAAQLLLATGAGATFEHVASSHDPADPIPLALTWAPALLGTLTAAANVEHARSPSDATRGALRILATASLGVGAALFAYDSVAKVRHASPRVAPLAFASAALLSLVLDREEEDIEETEQALERRARIVERLVPQRRTKFDRVVVHV